MTGVPPPEMSMCQRSLTPPSAHLSGKPFSRDVPSCCGPRQSSHPLYLSGAAKLRAQLVKPRSITNATKVARVRLILKVARVRLILRDSSCLDMEFNGSEPAA